MFTGAMLHMLKENEPDLKLSESALHMLKENEPDLKLSESAAKSR